MKEEDKATLQVYLAVVILIGILVGIMLFAKKQVEPTVICRKPSYIIHMHERRQYFVDQLTYPNHELSKQEVLKLTDSINKYNNILKD